MHSHRFALALKIFIALIAALLIFQLGMFVGFRKASFSYGWGDNYNRIFGGPTGGMMRDFSGKNMMNGHGTAGSVVSVDASGLVIKGTDGVEKVITVTDKTSVMMGRTALKTTDLKAGDAVVIIGRPQNDGTVSAEIIRVFAAAPPPSSLNLPPTQNQ